MGEPRRVLVAIEGADGVGKSTVADAVAREVGACSWYHDVRPGGEWTMALAFAHARAELCDALTSGARIVRGVRVGTGDERVVIADRWALSEDVLGRAHVKSYARRSSETRRLFDAEWATTVYTRPDAVVILTVADTDVWQRRITQRDGRPPTFDETRQRVVYDSWPESGSVRRVDAARPLAEVVADVVAIVREVTL